MRWNRFRCPVSRIRAASTTHTARPAAAAARISASQAAQMAGCMIASSAVRRAGSANTIAPRRLPVDPPGGVQNLLPECLDDRSVARRARLLKPSADPIGIHHGGPARREHGGDRGFPDADAPGQADEDHAGSAQNQLTTDN